jgi:hypothetical protein
MDGRETLRRIFVPRVVMVGLDAASAARCAEALAPLMIEPTKVAAPGAQQRILELMPVAVVIDHTLDPIWTSIVADVAAGVGADLVRLDEWEPDAATLAARLAEAVRRPR